MEAARIYIDSQKQPLESYTRNQKLIKPKSPKNNTLYQKKSVEGRPINFRLPPTTNNYRRQPENTSPNINLDKL